MMTTRQFILWHEIFAHNERRNYAFEEVVQWTNVLIVTGVYLLSSVGVTYTLSISYHKTVSLAKVIQAVDMERL